MGQVQELDAPSSAIKAIEGFLEYLRGEYAQATGRLQTVRGRHMTFSGPARTLEFKPVMRAS